MKFSVFKSDFFFASAEASEVFASFWDGVGAEDESHAAEGFFVDFEVEVDDWVGGFAGLGIFGSRSSGHVVLFAGAFMSYFRKK